MPFIRVGERGWMGGYETGFWGIDSLLDLIEIKYPNKVGSVQGES